MNPYFLLDEIKHHTLRENLRETLIQVTFLLTLFAGTISNYTTASLVLKCMLGTLLLIQLFVNQKINIHDLLHSQNFKKFLVISAALLIIPLLSITYSENHIYGFVKWLHLFSSFIPAAFSIIIILNNISNHRKAIFMLLLSSTTILIVSLILVFNPFDRTSSYIFELTRWSHVMIGRYLGSVFVILLCTYAINKQDKSSVLILFLLVLIMTGIYLTGLRAALIGTFLIILFFIIRFVFEKNWKHFVSLVSIIIVIFIGVFIQSGTDELSKRYESLFQIEELEFGGDGAINSRLHAWEISIERFYNNPIAGLGYGGFASYYENDFPVIIRYPHNLLLEYAVELGLIGILLFVFLLYHIFRAVYEYYPAILPFVFFTLWLAMFSKDISTNTLLWMFIGIIGVTPVKGKRQRVNG